MIGGFKRPGYTKLKAITIGQYIRAAPLEVQERRVGLRMYEGTPHGGENVA